MNRYLLIILSIIFSLVYIWSPGEHNSIYINSIFSVIVIISCYYIFSDEERSFSLFKVFHIFSLLFIALAPTIQFKTGTRFWDSKILTEDDYLKAAFIYLLCIIIYNTSYLRFKLKNIRIDFIDKTFDYTPNCKNLNFRTKFIFVSVSVIFFFYIFYINGFNIALLLLRGVVADSINSSRIETTQMSGLIIQRFIRPFNSILTMLFVLFYWKKYKYTSLCLLIISILTMAPTAVPRFAAAAIYLPLGLILFPLLRKKNNFSILLVLGVLIVWPLLNLFRTFDVSEGFNMEKFANETNNLFITGNMDSFSSLIQIVKYDIITYGRQLLGVILFWIPRSFWPDKPIGSGAFMADEINLDYSNLACNYFAEGYVNFGLIGCFIFSIILAYITAAIDNMYWSKRNGYKNKSNSFQFFYFITIGLFIFILRGDAMSSTAYTMGFCVSLFCVIKLFKILLK